MAGRLAGIARHAAPKGPMETIDHVAASVAEGVHGDFRSAFASTKRGRRRQVSLIEADGVSDAFAACHANLVWSDCRRNLLISGLRIPREAGTKLAIGASLVLEVTDRCDPCERMDALHEGLRAALEPDWRCGFLARVVSDGDIAVGDEIRIIE
ncbi:MOSC domain-containing protein [Tsuneonella sp. HG222]